MASKKIDTTVRRWCEVCQAFTRSRMDAYGNEICAEHRELEED
jgi:hypothetical protein